jgi:hypothetical protein
MLATGLVVGLAAGLCCWVVLILALFGDSEEYWPGWACAVPAVLVGGVVLAGFLGLTLGFRPAPDWARRGLADVPEANNQSAALDRPPSTEVTGEDVRRAVRD